MGSHSFLLRWNYDVVATPFLTTTRALGDFWSFNYTTNQYVISPEPHICDYSLDLSHQDFFILATNGLWKIMSEVEVVGFVKQKMSQKSTNLAKCLVVEAINRYKKSKQLADNITILITSFEGEAGLIILPFYTCFEGMMSDIRLNIDQVVPQSKKVSQWVNILMKVLLYFLGL